MKNAVSYKRAVTVLKLLFGFEVSEIRNQTPIFQRKRLSIIIDPKLGNIFQVMMRLIFDIKHQ